MGDRGGGGIWEGGLGAQAALVGCHLSARGQGARAVRGRAGGTLASEPPPEVFRAIPPSLERRVGAGGILASNHRRRAFG